MPIDVCGTCMCGLDGDECAPDHACSEIFGTTQSSSASTASQSSSTNMTSHSSGANMTSSTSSSNMTSSVDNSMNDYDGCTAVGLMR